MKTLLLPVLTILAAIPLAAADSVSGKWQLHQNIVGNESDLSCTFTQTGDQLAGTCDGPMGMVKVTGKISEKTVSFSFQSQYNGNPLTMTYTGTLASEAKITGKVNVDAYGVDGEFVATLAK